LPASESANKLKHLIEKDGLTCELQIQLTKLPALFYTLISRLAKNRRGQNPSHKMGMQMTAKKLLG
jgi:hypothetical protein